MMNPDQIYVKSGYALIDYEDNELQNIIRNVPDYYGQTDQTLYGGLLRVVAKELARIDYAYSYDIITGVTQNLSPADLLRVFREQIHLSRKYPSKTQYDQELKTLMIQVIGALRAGSKLSSIIQIINSFSQGSVTVEELFPKIGTGNYDVSDRNTISVSAKVSQNGVSIQEVQTLTEDLYSVLDLAKPAHVGIVLKAIFGLDENISSYIMGIQDELKISAIFKEAAPSQDGPLWTSPSIDGSPDTRLAPVDVKAVTIADVTLEGLYPQMGLPVYISEDDIIKVVRQTIPTQNGYYYAKFGPWVRFYPNTGLLSPLTNSVWEVSEKSDIIMDLG